MKSTSNTKKQRWKCIPEQSRNIELSPSRRWLIYIIGVFETFVFGGTVFGWAQLIYVLKNEGVFMNLCYNSTTGGNLSINTSTNIFDEDNAYLGCEAQDKKFALIYTITSLVYATPAILVGLMIHYCGLAASRISAASMIVIGFACLGLTTKEFDSLLNISMIWLALGGNQLRLSGFQFCNLFPRYRSTALTVISGSFAASAGLFMTFQFGQQYGISLRHMCTFFSILASGSIFFTFLMPWHHIPHDQPNEEKSNHDWRRDDLPVSHSLLSLSSLTHSIWMVLIMAAIIYFNTSFNSWISKISQSNEEAGQYSLLFSASAFICPLTTPLPGIITDYMSKRVSADSNLEDEIHAKLKSPILSLVTVTVVTLLLQVCLLFNNPVAVYLSLIALIILRPSVIAVGSDFLRIRFPPYHFYRIIGVYGTIISLLTVIQYPIFLWSQENLLWATLFFMFLILVTLVHPLHLLSKRYRDKVISESWKLEEKELGFLVQKPF